MKYSKYTKIMTLAIISVISFATYAVGPADDVPIDKNLNEKIVMIEDNDFFKSSLQTTIFKPPGNGPFPMVIFNHGHAPGALVYGRFQERERSIFFTREMLKRGYVVVNPMRKGYAGSGGGRPRAFSNQYEDVVTTYKYMINQGYIDQTKILIAGQSLGGYVSMMIASKNELIPNLKGVINFAGGLPTSHNVKFEDELSKFSKQDNTPSLWVYGDNDYLTNPEKLKLLIEAYQKNHPNFEVIRTGNFKYDDAHGLIYHPNGLDFWVPAMDNFLEKIGLPSKVINKIKYRTSKFNDFESIDESQSDQEQLKLMRTNKNQWNGYTKFKELSYTPKSFAISTENDRWAYSYGQDFTADIALKLCEIKGIKCRLFAIDDYLVK